MSSGLQFTETVKVSLRDSLPKFAPDPVLKLVPGVGDEGYTSLNKKTGLVYTTPKGFLPSSVLDLEIQYPEHFSVALGNEEDISKQVGSSVPVYSLPVGISYKDGSMTSAIVFRDAIVEYRTNIGVPSSKKSVIPGKDNVYGKTYYSVGIPEERFNMMESKVKEVYGIEMAKDPLSRGKIHNGYVWVNANVSKNHEPVCSVIKNAKQRDGQLLALMINFKQNIIVIEGDNVVRSFTFSLKQMQVIDTTDTASPGLATNIEFAVDTKAEATDKFWETFERLNTKSEPTGTRRMLPTGMTGSTGETTIVAGHDSSTINGGTTVV
ncbi:hypothetical protein HDU81_000556 [Chytriomyces hyalinus]|nr:hypothetical protein HDU81_000556 [Chytriomyces hyalinus]